MTSDSKYIFQMLLRGLCGVCAGVSWWYITKEQNVMIGSIYELKYIVILALFYIFFGDSKFTLNTGIGISLSIMGIYFISKK